MQRAILGLSDSPTSPYSNTRTRIARREAVLKVPSMTIQMSQLTTSDAKPKWQLLMSTFALYSFQ